MNKLLNPGENAHQVTRMLFDVKCHEELNDNTGLDNLLRLLASVSVSKVDPSFFYQSVMMAGYLKEITLDMQKDLGITGDLEYMMKHRHLRFVLVGRLLKLVSETYYPKFKTNITLALSWASTLVAKEIEPNSRIEGCTYLANMLHTDMVRLANNLAIHPNSKLASWGVLSSKVIKVFDCHLLDDNNMYRELAILTQLLSVFWVGCMQKLTPAECWDVTVCPKVNRYFRHILT